MHIAMSFLYPDLALGWSGCWADITTPRLFKEDGGPSRDLESAHTPNPAVLRLTGFFTWEALGV